MVAAAPKEAADFSQFEWEFRVEVLDRGKYLLEVAKNCFGRADA